MAEKRGKQWGLGPLSFYLFSMEFYFKRLFQLRKHDSRYVKNYDTPNRSTRTPMHPVLPAHPLQKSGIQKQTKPTLWRRLHLFRLKYLLLHSSPDKAPFEVCVCVRCACTIKGHSPQHWGYKYLSGRWISTLDLRFYISHSFLYNTHILLTPWG